MQFHEIHPGVTLRDELAARGLSAASLALKLRVPPQRLHEIVRADAIFAATGVTNGALLDGVRIEAGFAHTHTLVMNSSSRTVREVRMKRAL